MLYAFIIFTTHIESKFNIKLLNSKKMIAIYNGNPVLSSFYSPVEFKFKETEGDDLYFYDTLRKTNIKFPEGIPDVPSAQPSENVYSLVFNGMSLFYIMKDGKCLESDQDNIFTPRYTNLKFNTCNGSEKQKWELVIKVKDYTNKEKVFIPDTVKHPTVHDHYYYKTKVIRELKKSKYKVYHPRNTAKEKRAHGHIATVKVFEGKKLAFEE